MSQSGFLEKGFYNLSLVLTFDDNLDRLLSLLLWWGWVVFRSLVCWWVVGGWGVVAV